jgi:hypothetical protein
MSKALGCLLLCAWILWQETFIENTKARTDIIEALESKNECEDAISGMIARAKKRGSEVGPATSGHL